MLKTNVFLVFPYFLVLETGNCDLHWTDENGLKSVNINDNITVYTKYKSQFNEKCIYRDTYYTHDCSKETFDTGCPLVPQFPSVTSYPMIVCSLPMNSVYLALQDTRIEAHCELLYSSLQRRDFK